MFSGPLSAISCQCVLLPHTHPPLTFTYAHRPSTGATALLVFLVFLSCLSDGASLVTLDSSGLLVLWPQHYSRAAPLSSLPAPVPSLHLCSQALYRCHSAPVVFLGFLSDDASLVTLDSSGLLVLWPQHSSEKCGFGWLKPRARWQLPHMQRMCQLRCGRGLRGSSVLSC